MRGPLPEGAGFETLAIHAGQPPDATTGAVTFPIHISTTFAQDGVGGHQGFQYARTSNPTRLALEQCLAALEGAAHGYAFSSGIAAADSLLRQLTPGAHIVLATDGYGGTYRLLTQLHKSLRFDTCDLADPMALAATWQADTALVWVESPTNPSLAIVDIAAVAAFSHTRGALCIVDNTFATPYLQRPLALGADAVMHSTTKYLGGHSDVIGGFVALNDPTLAEGIRTVQVAAGAVPSPFDCFLVLRGIKTLAVRMDRHCSSALGVAEALSSHPAVADVLYPGLPGHRNYALATRQMRGYGGMIGIRLRGGRPAALAMASRVRLFTLGESLGGVESLLGYP
ncbi:MAG: PLP-dependent transferase, partial [Pseudonocardiaceae bacterium]